MGISLDLDGIEVAYGSTPVLHALSLAVEPGEFFCLLGPSGCGKSTLLNVVAGFLRPRAGKVLLGGEDVARLPPQARRIGVVFQSYALYPHMTVTENVGYGLKVQGRPAAEVASRVAEMLALARLTGKEARYPRELSGGEQQRVAIARALAIEPRLLLLDEPLSNLDAKLRDEMRSELKRIQRTSGVTTVFVTHDQSEALGMGDRVAVLNAGRVEQVGEPREIYRTPRTEFVARFIGHANILRGILTGPSLEVMGQRLDVSSSTGGSTGAASLFLRPEELWIGNAPRAGNSLAGVVTDATYGGAAVSYRVQTGVGELEVCHFGSAVLDAPVGISVHVGWPAEAGYLMPGAGDG